MVIRIGELAQQLGVSTDTLRFYERAGWLPAPERAQNGYRSYRAADVDHLRLLLDLRRIDLPLDEAARLASWCHAGHCESTSSSLPAMIARRRADMHGRMADLRQLDERLADLQGHLVTGDGLTLIGEAEPCCSSAAAVFGAVEGGCRCCAAPDGAASTKAAAT